MIPRPALLLLLLVGSSARAGLHYSKEDLNPLPSQWRGFLIDQRQLRLLAIPPAPKTPVSAYRVRYEKALTDLEGGLKEKKLTPDEWADLGAVLVRLGRHDRAVAVLREAHGLHPKHYRIASNPGTAWQMSGNPAEAEAALRDAVALAPGKFQRAEEMQLALVRSRRREPNGQELDPLLGIRFVNDKGDYEPGRLAAEEKKKLSTAAAADLQMLALWLPADGRILWLLAELAAVHGDVRTAAAIMDGCVNEFALRSPTLRKHRQAMREAADALAKAEPTTKREHEQHAVPFKSRSMRPLLDREALASLPPIKPDGVNSLAWAAVTMTTVDRQYKPTFPAYLRELDGREVSLIGHMQPIGGDPDANTFLLIEYPVGCWYCEAPEITAMILIEMPPGKSRRFTRDAVRVKGKLKLNATDPEDFLFKLSAADVSAAE